MCSSKRSCRSREFVSRTGHKYFSAFTGAVDLLQYIKMFIFP